eukprot:CAMPEP_0183313258 /NCGR_PEP_ID=MMETSP0160_2-20130417/44640_1 /TAXON_ID=2839 ORGANISM="Odontella Sinensis, Strain Grunow 1884" /NCGR_SAMPLE_ID=MMETSP0160_2 /ASSEMBLY_ACC=CAM_ASM_000250 /LENGTH=32 /DNA_ID= /DNA_START= /DNA_END= /DNA_ORIENTATION=
MTLLRILPLLGAASLAVTPSSATDAPTPLPTP